MLAIFPWYPYLIWCICTSHGILHCHDITTDGSPWPWASLRRLHHSLLRESGWTVWSPVTFRHFVNGLHDVNMTNLCNLCFVSSTWNIWNKWIFRFSQAISEVENSVFTLFYHGAGTPNPAVAWTFVPTQLWCPATCGTPAVHGPVTAVTALLQQRNPKNNQ